MYSIDRCHCLVRTSVRGSWFDTIAVQKKEIYFARFLFIFFFTDSSANLKKIHLDVKLRIINTIITFLYFI